MIRVEGYEPCLGWVLMHDDYEDGDGFLRNWWEAHHFSGAHRILQVSDFSFTMNQDRFNWLVENDFPHSPTKGPWSSDEIDRRIASASVS